MSTFFFSALTVNGWEIVEEKALLELFAERARKDGEMEIEEERRLNEGTERAKCEKWQMEEVEDEGEMELENIEAAAGAAVAIDSFTLAIWFLDSRLIL